MNRILLIQTAFIGDCVLSTPVVSALRQVYPNAEIFVLTTPVSSSIFKQNPLIKEVITFDKRGKQRGFFGLWKFANKLSEYKFDLVFSLHKSWRTAALLALAGIPRRYGFSDASARFLYTKTAKRKDQTHEVLRSLSIMRNVGFEPYEFAGDLLIELSDDALSEADSLGVESGTGVISIAPGSVWATKRWIAEGFAAVAKELLMEGHRVVLIGGPDDVPVCKEVEELSGKGILNLAGKTSLLGAAAIIKRSKLLLSNDSSPLHFASAMKTPVVAIFCATVPEFGFGPWKTEHEIVEVPGLGCRPCGAHGPKMCPTGTDFCRREITHLNVLFAVKRLLGKTL